MIIKENIDKFCVCLLLSWRNFFFQFIFTFEIKEQLHHLPPSHPSAIFSNSWSLLFQLLIHIYIFIYKHNFLRLHIVSYMYMISGLNAATGQPIWGRSPGKDHFSCSQNSVVPYRLCLWFVPWALLFLVNMTCPFSTLVLKAMLIILHRCSFWDTISQKTSCSGTLKHPASSWLVCPET